MAFSPPPVAPQRGDRTTFSGRVDAFLLWLTALIPQLNTFVSSLTTLAAGGANSFSYGFDTSTANGDPGAGRVRFGSSPQNTANVIRVSGTPGNGGAIGAFLTALQSGTSNVKSAVRFQKIGDVTSYLLFDITAVAAVAGYYNLTVTPRTSSASSPFAANDTVLMFFDPKGDKGDSGGTPTQAEIIAAIGTLGVDHGGTGATTAPNALANLGGFPSAGGNLTGSVTMVNGTSVSIKDSDGTPRQAFGMGSDNQFNMSVAGGNGFNIFNQALNTLLWAIDNLGNVSHRGSLIMPNAVPIKMKTTDNTARSVMQIASNNNVQHVNAGGNNWQVLNQAANTVILNVTDAGVLTAPVVTETSDERKKTNWRRLTDEQLDALAEMDLVGVFDWIDGSGTAVGASAQQIQAIVPWAVHERTAEDGSKSLTVAYGGLAFAMAHGALRRSRRAVA